jgi:hypothetical protein
VLKERRMFVACRTDDDLPYILKWASHNLVIGSDFGHKDTASEIDALQTLRQNGKLAPEVVDGILDHNACTLYGLGG